MSLSNGSRLGPFEIVSAIGAGGMGEVYRARDTKLGRDVAIKVLPDVFAHDAERMARFGREAKLLAALDHPNIATIHGLEDTDNSRALVMQLAEGPTLADRIALGPIPVDDALRIARQIADALEYAHEHGIIHRDLKPANVKVAADDTVKILDFGLAKALESGSSAADIANSPTLSQMATQAGVLLGTAAYMSPEQAKGKPVDRRADIWAFGCVLYEMLTGRKPFSGDTVTDMLAAVITKDPDWSLLPAAIPTRVRVLLQRCLQKDPKVRLRDIGDARISLDEVLSGAPESASVAPVVAPSWRRAIPWVLFGAVTIAFAALAFVFFRAKPSAVPVPLRFRVAPPENTTVAPVFSLSPDGRKLAFVGLGQNGKAGLWVHSFDSGESRYLVEGGGPPFWSPDSRFIGYPDAGKLKKIEATGGPPQTLADLPVAGFGGGSWNRDDVIVFGTPKGLYRVPASGGIPVQITAVDPKRGEDYHYSPSFLPDGRHVVYTRDVSSSGSGIYVASLGAKPEQQSSQLLVGSNWGAEYAPGPDASTGYLLFMREGTLMAQSFDAHGMTLTGQPTTLAEQVDSTGGNGGIGAFSTSSTGTLVYMAGGGSVARSGSRGNIQGQLTWFDREGKSLGAFGDPGVYRTLAISPDGKRVAFERADSKNNRNLWIYDLARGVTSRFTFNAPWDSGPVWSPDGSRIAFGSLKSQYFDLYRKASNLAGDEQLLLKSDAHKIPTSWSPDGRFLLYENPVPPDHIWVLPLDGASADRKPVRFDHSTFDEVMARFSPDGRWVAYTSAESGRNEVYVRPFNAATVTGSSSGGAHVTGKWMVSTHGGNSALWRHDGKELFYLAPDGMAMAVDVKTSGVFQAGVPKALFKVPEGVAFWDVSPDGKRFLMAAPSATKATPAPKFSVVLNWQDALGK